MITILQGSLYVLGVLIFILFLVIPLLLLIIEVRKRKKLKRQVKKHHQVESRKTFGANRIKGKGNSQAMGNVINHYTAAGISEREKSFVETINILIQNNFKAEDRHQAQLKFMYAQHQQTNDKLEKVTEENDALWDEVARLKYELQEMAHRVPFVELRFPDRDKLTG